MDAQLVRGALKKKTDCSRKLHNLCVQVHNLPLLDEDVSSYHLKLQCTSQ